MAGPDIPVGDIKGDIFDVRRAAYYLDLESVRTLEIFERDYGLRGQIIGKRKIYHRVHLDAAVRRAFGITEKKSG
ncbi:MAG TPA: hypothetical protein VGP99_10535 [Tepidisphaeraceae bacterium]|jgi:hypothetical protein|nr:hypothetical protein [Tepidisphaeraceae bacterium]